MTLNKAVFEEYAALKNEEKEIAAKIDKLKPAMMAEIDQTEEKAVTTPFGNFSITTRKTYKYSPAIKVAQEAVDNMMNDEVATGKATFTESRSVRFEVPKVKKEE